MNQKIMQNCIPSIIALTLTGLYSIVDGLFIGNVVGENGLAAVNVAWPLPAFVTALGTGIGTGGCILYSMQKGGDKPQGAHRALKMTYFLLICASVLVTAVLLPLAGWILHLLGARGEVHALAHEYACAFLAGSLFSIIGAGMVPILRGIQRAGIAMAVTVAGMFTNLLADYILIVRCGLGMTGAAAGSVLAQAVVCVLSIAYLLHYRKKHPIQERSVLRLSEMRPETVQNHFTRRWLPVGKRILSLGFAAFGTSISATIVLAFTNWQCLRYGSTSAVAAYAAISYITFPAQYILQGVSEGMLPLVSFAYGADRREELKELSGKAFCMIAVLGTVLLVTVQILTSTLAGCFGLSGAGQEMFLRGLRISSLAFLGIGYVKWNIAYLNGTSQSVGAVALTYGESFIVAPTLLWLLPKWLGLDGVWIAFVGTAVGMLLIYAGVVGRKRIDKD